MKFAALAFALTTFVAVPALAAPADDVPADPAMALAVKNLQPGQYDISIRIQTSTGNGEPNVTTKNKKGCIHEDDVQKILHRGKKQASKHCKILSRQVTDTQSSMTRQCTLGPMQAKVSGTVKFPTPGHFTTHTVMQLTGKSEHKTMVMDMKAERLGACPANPSK